MGSSGHPDTEQGDKWSLTVRACEWLQTRLPTGFAIAIWMEYCCIDQDMPIIPQISALEKIISQCDALLTPILD